MRRVRLTVGGLMLLVAIVGIIASVGVRVWMKKQDGIKAARYQALSAEYRLLRDLEESDCRTEQSSLEGTETILDSIRQTLKVVGGKPSADPELAGKETAFATRLRRELVEFEGEAGRHRLRRDRAARRMSYYEAMRQKYDYAMNHPRIYIAPDPPLPK